MKWTIRSRWKKRPYNKRHPRASDDHPATQAAMLTSDDGQTRHVWKVNGRWVDVDGHVYDMKEVG